MVKKRRIELPGVLDEWFEQALSKSAIELVPLTPQIASKAAFLPDIHKDPVDRVIIATAILNGATLLTKDETIRGYPDIKTKWQE